MILIFPTEHLILREPFSFAGPTRSVDGHGPEERARSEQRAEGTRGQGLTPALSGNCPYYRGSLGGHGASPGLSNASMTAQEAHPGRPRGLPDSRRAAEERSGN
jgi:hypothetical protein